MYVHYQGITNARSLPCADVFATVGVTEKLPLPFSVHC